MTLTVRLSSHDLAFLVKIFEGYSHLTVVKTLEGKQGLALLIFPAAMLQDVNDILDHFPRKLVRVL